ncbi:phosphomannomutase CpsG [Acinetobacter sp. VNH17]|uniref:phosphomannomutase n=1 Tax=Acinetobacter thutiue TaxID=2998078 RepID=A0ABT7WSA5_9GAMM|nr:phosphomannomutase CpsG [Acinetobacter thutiue]MCY6413459.1 phosphomannomutase CpsG [Acinetobacter thutiue]MDN0015568.1 phosphomannomutase CpsG [Acinetobacter thutiue]
MNITCVKAYDIRGELNSQLNEDIAYRIGRAYGDLYQAKTVAVGCDIRLSSESLKQATIKGLNDAGVDVLDLGMTGTEQVYFAAFYLDVQGGIEITASHNPMNYNGMKLVRENAKPISIETGLKDIQHIAERGNFKSPSRLGTTKFYNILPEFINHLMTYIDLNQLKPLRLVVNAGNGAAGPVIDAIEQRFIEAKVPVEFIKINHQPDGSFPNGIPNPILLENQGVTSQAVIEHHADLGIAWDGDFDRCFLFDENGQFIEGYYIVGLLSEAFLSKTTNERIIHDPRLTWNTLDIVQQYGGITVQSKSGHAFIKEVMRAENAIYGGEMSAHHYFRDFGYCDSGMIPWLLVIDLLSRKQTSLSSLVNGMIHKYPCSGEINFKVSDAQYVIQQILSKYQELNPKLDKMDGVSCDFGTWRFNIRSSNTEPLLRLNVETQGDNAKAQLMQYIEELSQLIRKFS